jgi:hypothetical protein
VEVAERKGLVAVTFQRLRTLGRRAQRRLPSPPHRTTNSSSASSPPAPATKESQEIATSPAEGDGENKELSAFDLAKKRARMRR